MLCYAKNIVAQTKRIKEYADNEMGWDFAISPDWEIEYFIHLTGGDASSEMVERLLLLLKTTEDYRIAHI